MITLLSSLFGILTSLMPSILKILERRMEFKYEVELTKLRIEAATKGYQFSLNTEEIKSVVVEGQSIRDHDLELDGNQFIDTLRSSVRPVVTYVFFTVFILVKLFALLIMTNQGVDMSNAINIIWDVNTQSIFAAILGFWFGSRTISLLEEKYSQRPVQMVKIKE